MAVWAAVGGTLCASIDWEVGVEVVSDGFLGVSRRFDSVVAGTLVVGTVLLVGVDESTGLLSGPSVDGFGERTAGGIAEVVVVA